MVKKSPIIKYELKRLFGCLTLLCIVAAPSLASSPTLKEFVSNRLSQNPVKDWSYRQLTFDDICAIGSDALARRVFSEYGSVYAAELNVRIPWKCIFDNSEDVARFQKVLKVRAAVIENVPLELQEAAMNSLQMAALEGAQKGLRIVPLDGPIAGRRSYYDTLRLWYTRFSPGLEYWIRAGRITEEEATAARLLSSRKQTEKIIEWETAGIWFSTDRSRTIFSSTAPPGTSQHLSLLALDVENYADSEVRELLALHGWYQTILNDPTHFTYIGVPEIELPGRGLTIIIRGPFRYWVPRM